MLHDASTVAALGFESVTVKIAFAVPALPSTTRTSSIDIRGTGSSFRIVPWPCASAITPKSGFERSTTKVSFGSSFVSPTTGTSTSCVVVPGGNEARPEALWKSPSASVAEPSAATQSTSTSCVAGNDSEIVKRAFDGPAVALRQRHVVDRDVRRQREVAPPRRPTGSRGASAYSWIVQRSTSFTGSTCVALKSPQRFTLPVKIL